MRKFYAFAVAILLNCRVVGQMWGQCSPESLPYYENFDNRNDLSCFITSRAQLSSIYSVTSGGKSVVLSTDASNGAYIVLPAVDIEGNALECYFKIRGGSYDVSFSAGIVTDTTNVTDSYQPIYLGSIEGGAYAWQDVEFNTSTSLTSSKPAFVCIYIGSGNNTDIYVDNIDIHDIPSCPRPSMMTCTATTPNSATYSWTAGGSETSWRLSYELKLGGTTVQDTSVVVNQPTYTISNLAASSAYTLTADLYALCSESDTSLSREYAGGFSTGCVVITSFPYTEDFESGIIPNTCENKFNPFNDYYSTVSDLTITTSQVHSGSYAIKATDGNIGNMPSLALPQMNFTDPNGYTVKFWAYRDNYYPSSYPNEGFQISVSPVNNSLTQATTLGFIPRGYTLSPSEVDPGWYQYSFDIPSTITGLYYVIISYVNQYGTYGYFDDVTVQLSDNCRTLNATAENVSYATADIVADDSTATAWQIYYGENSASGTPYVINVSDSSHYTLTGLTSNTEYAYYVSRICGNDTSDWSSARLFKTLQMADTLPFITGFETTDDNNWDITTGGSSAFFIGEDTNGVYSGSRALYVSYDNYTYGYDVTGNCQAYASKLFHFDETTYNISFKYKCTGGEINSIGTTIYDFGRIFLVPGTTEFTGGSEWMTYGSYEGNWPAGLISIEPEAHNYYCKETGDANGWNTMSRAINMVGRSGNYKFVLMWNNESSGEEYPLAIDELAITLVTCAQPNTVVSQLTSTSANIAASGAASHRIVVSTQPIDIYGTIVADVMDTTVTSNVDITGLTANTTYYYSVRGYCTNGDTSDWTASTAFTTECIATVPYTESFEQASILDCWSHAGDNALVTDDTRAQSGIKSLLVNNVIAISPELDVDSMAKYNLTGWIYSTAADVLNIGVALDPTDGSTFDIVASANIPANTWTEFTAPFTLLNDPDYEDFALARHFTLSMTNGSAFNADNLFFGLVPECTRPTNPVITDTVHNGFKMTWTDESADQWIVRIIPTAGGDTITVITDTQYVEVNTLVDQTQYSVEVAAICGLGDYSLYESCGTITTPIYVPTCPDPTTVPVINATTASTMTVTAGGEYISYEFAYATTSSTSSFIGVVPSATNRIVLTGLTYNTTYYVWYRGVCEPGDTSRWSIAAAGTTTNSDFFMPQNIHVVGIAQATSTTIAWGGCPDAHIYAYELVNETSGEVSTDTVVFTTLDPATTYTIRVCAVDTVTPDSTAWVSLTFKTVATPAVIPYFCDFESPVENANWTFVDNGQANQFVIGSVSDFGTTTNALFVSGNGTNNTYVNTPSTVYALRTMNLNAGTYRFSYNWVCAGEPGWNVGTAWDYPRIFLAPAEMQFEAGTVAEGIGYNFEEIPDGCMALDSGTHLTQALSTRTVNGSLELQNAGVYNFVIFWTNDNSTMYDPAITVDSIKFTQVIEGDTFTDTICNGEDYNEHGFNVPASQLFTGVNNLTRIATGAIACPDTIIRANVTMLPAIERYIYDTICAGDNYNLYGYSLVTPQTGYYPKRGDISFTGCDSTTHLYLFAVQTSTVQQETICKGDSYYWHGQSYNTAGTYTYNGPGARGCNVNDTLYLFVLDGDTTYNVQICNGGSYIFGDTIITTAGTYTRRIYDYFIGCTVTHTINATMVSSKTVTLNDIACEGHPYTNYGLNIPVVTKDTVVTYTLPSVENCDSTTILNLTFVATVTSEFDDTIPATGIYYWGGKTLTEPGDYPLTLMSLTTGCDSVVTLHLHAYVTGVEAVADVHVELIPNPVRSGEIAMIYGNFSDIAAVEVLNSLGQIVESFVPASYPIEVGGISAPGIYYVRLTTQKGDVHVEKLIVR